MEICTAKGLKGPFCYIVSVLHNFIRWTQTLLLESEEENHFVCAFFLTIHANEYLLIYSSSLFKQR